MSLHKPQRVRVVVENWTPAGVSRTEGPWRTVPPGMAPERANELLFRAALGDFAAVSVAEVTSDTNNGSTNGSGMEDSAATTKPNLPT